MNTFVVLVAFYCLDQVKRACGLKWKVFRFKFGVMSELTQLKVAVSEEVGVGRKKKSWLGDDSPKQKY